MIVFLDDILCITRDVFRDVHNQCCVVFCFNEVEITSHLFANKLCKDGFDFQMDRLECVMLGS